MTAEITGIEYFLPKKKLILKNYAKKIIGHIKKL